MSTALGLILVHYAGEFVTVAAGDGNEAALDACEKLYQKHGPNHPTPTFKMVGAIEVAKGSAIAVDEKPVTAPAVMPVQFGAEGQATVSSLDVTPSAPLYSDFGEGKQIVDASAVARIEAQHAVLIANGVKVDSSEQLYATGTRMAAVGYETQNARKAEHDRKMSLVDAAHALSEKVKSEKRADQIVSSRELGNTINVNGKIHACGLELSEQAIRGLIQRLESPALAYVLGLRDRVAEELSKEDNERDADAIASDKARIAETLRHECLRNPDVTLKLRTRDALKDIYAITSEGYANADAPEVLASILESLPADAKGSFRYDPRSTQWHLDASVWTPTPEAEQAVGEAFRGYVRFSARDNGTSKFRGGGGVELIRCLNASTYVATNARAERVHRGAIMFDIEAMLREAMGAINALCKAWGTNRATDLVIPEKVTIEQAIPGFYRAMLAEKPLAHVLRGRTNDHIEGLAAAFYGERRVSDRLVRSDLAQGWTKYIQSQQSAIRNDSEIAIGAWLAVASPVRCDLRA